MRADHRTSATFDPCAESIDSGPVDDVLNKAVKVSSSTIQCSSAQGSLPCVSFTITMHAIWDDEPLADTRRSPVQFHETTTPGAINITTFYESHAFSCSFYYL